jgi:Flp pilus assembly pilin Flp
MFRKFRNDEEGAVTVDWVVLTAAVVGLGVAALAAVKGGTGALTSKISSHLSSQTISTTF